MPTITKDHARKIAKKLKALIDKSARNHEIAKIYYEGRLVASFGIRRGSNRNLPHGHIPEELHLSHHDTLQLANCPMSYEQWIQHLVDSGWIEPNE